MSRSRRGRAAAAAPVALAALGCAPALAFQRRILSGILAGAER